MIYHLTSIEDYLRLTEKLVLKPESLKKEGFVHCSFEEDVLESATIHFPDASELAVLCIVEKRVRKDLKTEPSRSGKLFPHIYGPIPVEAVEDVLFLDRDDAGKFVWRD